MDRYTKYWFLEGFDFFQKMNRKNLMAMCKHVETVYIKKGDTLNYKLPDMGNVVYFLKNGVVKIVNQSNEHTKYVLQKGSLFGEFGADEEGTPKDKAVVLKEGNICFISAKEIQHLMEENPSLKNKLIKINGLRIKKLERRLEDLLYKDSRTRIIEYMFDYVFQFGIQKEGNTIAEALLSHQDIASLTNTSRQTVSNTLSTLRKEGVIDYNSGSISIPNNQNKSLKRKYTHVIN